MRPEVATDAGLGDGNVPQVIATCSHDTAAAVAAVPAEGEDWAFLSSGTWSLLGVELPEPLIDERVRQANFTNEAGFNGTTRFLKNIVGLYVLQELRRAWAADGMQLDYAELTEQARSAGWISERNGSAEPRFGAPGRMPEKVAAFCRETGQPAPESPGQFARCVLESLALLYRSTLEQLALLTGRSIARIHVVGGGSRSDLLNQFTADATGRAVIAGPVEASAIGNALVQAFALGHIGPAASAVRDVVRASFPTRRFTPSGDPRWRAAHERFQRLPVV
jgi:rhamnulokinase